MTNCSLSNRLTLRKVKNDFVSTDSPLELKIYSILI